MWVGDFIEDSNRAQSLDDLATSYFKALNQIGFTKSVYTILSTKHPLHEGKCPGYISNYDASWLDHYKQNNYVEEDPVYRLSPAEKSLVSWDDIEAFPLSKKQKMIADERRDAGIKNGLSVFIAAPAGELSAISVANDGAPVNLNKNLLDKLRAVINQFNLRCFEIKAPPPGAAPPQLSRRERDVLRWASDGKSNSSIASILGISEKTVEFHFSSVFRKFQVNNRILAVLKALKERLI